MGSCQSTVRIIRPILLFVLGLLVTLQPSEAQQNEPNGQVQSPRQVQRRVEKPNPPLRVNPIIRIPARVQPQAAGRPATMARQEPPRTRATPVLPARAQATQRAALNNRGAGGANPSGFRIPPNARKVAMPGGGAMVVSPNGRRWVMNKNNQVAAFSQPGMQAKYYGDGKLNSVQITRPRTGLLTVTRYSQGGQEVRGLRPGGIQVVNLGKGHGYVDRPLPGRNGYYQRTYLAGGRSYAHVYRACRYQSMVYYRYVAPTQYNPQFYKWVGTPFRKQATYNWNSAQAPWLSSYASYFSPAPSYPNANLWLTDFVVQQNLKTAYENQPEQPNPSGSSAPETISGGVALSPEVRAALSQEVQQAVADEQAATIQSGGRPPAPGVQTPPPALDPNQRTLVVSENLEINQESTPCTLTPGDVIYRSGDSVVAGNKAAVNVVASKAGDCPANTQTQLEVNTLQGMHNEFREQIDAGLGKLADIEGQEGFPSGPAPGARPVPEGTAQPDSNVATTLEQQQSDADAAVEGATENANGG